MTQNTLTEMNEKQNEITIQKRELTIKQTTLTRDIIKLSIQLNFEKNTDLKVFRKAMNSELEADSNEINNYTKRAITIAYGVVIEKYRFKIDVLTISQMETLVNHNKNMVNRAMKIANIDEYVDEIKYLINMTKIEKMVMQKSTKLARAHKNNIM